jgi:alpha-1,3-rhamnosyl/mannosyltransferase
MQVVFDARPVTARMAGIGRYCVGLLSELARRGDLDVAALGDSRTAWDRLPGTLHREVLADGMAWHAQALRRFRALRGHVYHSPSSALASGWIGARAVVTVLDLAPVLLPDTATLRTRLAYAVLRRTVRRAGAVLCASHATRADLAAHWQTAAHVTPLGVPAWTTSAGARAAPTADRYFLAVGTREPRKNLPFVVAAHAAARARDPSLPRLIVAGGRGWGRDLAVDPRAGVCQLLDYVSDAELISLYRGATALVAASLCEGFDLPLLEAMACGTPVLASAIAVHREVAGDGALWFDPTDRDGLRDLLLAVSREPARLSAVAERGRAAASAYSWSRCADETLAVYRRLRVR